MISKKIVHRYNPQVILIFHTLVSFVQHVILSNWKTRILRFFPASSWLYNNCEHWPGLQFLGSRKMSNWLAKVCSCHQIETLAECYGAVTSMWNMPNIIARSYHNIVLYSMSKMHNNNSM
jgi:hypothetical protein